MYNFTATNSIVSLSEAQIDSQVVNSARKISIIACKVTWYFLQDMNVLHLNLRLLNHRKSCSSYDVHHEYIYMQRIRHPKQVMVAIQVKMWLYLR